MHSIAILYAMQKGLNWWKTCN